MTDPRPNWCRVPTWIGGRLHGDHVATEAEAWVDLLARWHQGEDVTACDFVRATKWGKGRVLAFLPKVADWARVNDATMPRRWQIAIEADRPSVPKRTGQRTGASEDVPAESNGSGPESDRAADRNRTASCARVPSSERDETRRDGITQDRSPCSHTDSTPTGAPDADHPSGNPASPRVSDRAAEPLPHGSSGPASRGGDTAGGAGAARGEPVASGLPAMSAPLFATATQGAPTPPPAPSIAPQRTHSAADGASKKAKRPPHPSHAAMFAVWSTAHMDATGQKYVYGGVCRARMAAILDERIPRDEDPAEALAVIQRAAEAFHRKPFDTFPAGWTVMGFSTDLNRWIQASRPGLAVHTGGRAGAEDNRRRTIAMLEGAMKTIELRESAITTTFVEVP